MSLTEFFNSLIAKVEASEEITNAGKDEGGFYRPTRTIILRNLTMMRDLHAKPLAKPMLKGAWASLSKDLPAEWLIPSASDAAELKKILE